MAASEEISTTPSGIQIVYQDKAHRYKLRLLPGTPDDQDTEEDKAARALRYVPSVSTILDKSLPKNLAGWSERLAVQGMLELHARGRPIVRMGPDALLDEMKSNGLRYFQQRDKAALRGTSVHSAFEQLAEGTAPKLTDFPVDERGYIQAIARWWFDAEPEVIHSELMVASWVHQYAGRMDLLAKVDGKVGVIDLKTSKAVRDSHHFQTAGYRLAVVESGYPTPKFGAILRVGAEGEYEYVEALASVSQFVALHRSYSAQREFEQSVKAAAKAEEKKAA